MKINNVGFMIIIKTMKKSLPGLEDHIFPKIRVFLNKIFLEFL